MIDNSHFNKDIFNGLIKVVITEKKDGNFRVDDNDDFGENVKKLRVALGVDKIIAPVAEHGGTVVLHDDKNLIQGPGGVWRTKEAADGYIITTKDKPAALLFAVADCPCVIALAELPPRDYILGLIHCGWKPLSAGILDNFLEKLGFFTDKFRIDKIRYSLRVMITPGIGPCCFGVGNDVIEKLSIKYHRCNEMRGLEIRDYFIARKNSDHIYIDLFKLCWVFFGDKGAGDLFSLKICTKCSGRFFSHRRRDKERNAVIVAFSPQAFLKKEEPKKFKDRLKRLGR